MRTYSLLGLLFLVGYQEPDNCAFSCILIVPIAPKVAAGGSISVFRQGYEISTIVLQKRVTPLILQVPRSLEIVLCFILCRLLAVCSLPWLPLLRTPTARPRPPKPKTSVPAASILDGAVGRGRYGDR